MLAALVLRFGFIMAGTRVLEAVSWVAVPFGAVLLLSAVQVWRGWRLPAGGGRAVKLLSRLVPVVPLFLGVRLTVRNRGRRAVTMAGVVLLVILGVDVVFAVDAVAAVLAITDDAFLVWAANAFAVLGLHSLYFGLAVLVRRFRYLRAALAALLVFAGVELMLSETPVGRPPVAVNLGIVVVSLTAAIVGSVLTARHAPASGDADAGNPGDVDSAEFRRRHS
ncbi:TerC family protein [Micromonospora sp. WMMD737]|uniref:TerC family protein n=1 Tax=Micromonospora sp. WMMD737 TaxID=3404113 RepID=UPI003B95B087